jgi:predicted N-acetyltransferase YhbS
MADPAPYSAAYRQLLSIEPIDDGLWDEIQRIQAEAYHQIQPESTDTLRSKWLATPEACFVARRGAGGPVLAYLLAHRWDEEAPPKLHQPIAAQQAAKGRRLFLHDLAVSRCGTGQGLGRCMVEHLFAVARKLEIDAIRLVAIQGSVPFWRKRGFEPLAGARAGSSYGADATPMQRLLAGEAARWWSEPLRPGRVAVRHVRCRPVIATRRPAPSPRTPRAYPCHAL